MTPQEAMNKARGHLETALKQAEQNMTTAPLVACACLLVGIAKAAVEILSIPAPVN